MKNNDIELFWNLKRMGSVQWLISPMMPSLLMLYDGRLSFGFARLAQYEVILDIFAVCWGLWGISLDLGISASLFNQLPLERSRAWMLLNGVHRKQTKLQGDWELWWFPTWSWLPGAPHHILTWDLLLPSWSCLTPYKSHTLFADQSPGWLSYQHLSLQKLILYLTWANFAASIPKPKLSLSILRGCLSSQHLGRPCLNADCSCPA